MGRGKSKESKLRDDYEEIEFRLNKLTFLGTRKGGNTALENKEIKELVDKRRRLNKELGFE